MVANRRTPRRTFRHCSRIAYNRTFDEFRRAQETTVVVTNVRHSAKVRLYDSEDRVCGYALTNAAGRGVSVSLAYDGSYVTNTVYTMPNGSSFSAKLTREAARRDLVTRRDYFFGGQSMYWYSTEYDLLNRPTNATDSVSLVREWLYNRRSELAAASVGTNRYGYAYDTIGNRLWSAANSETNSYAANCLNQYTSVSAGANPVYDADGNMTGDGTFAYAYDAENRLVSACPVAPSNGALAVENRYDHRNYRIRKLVKVYQDGEWLQSAAHTFVWDGSNIVLERVEFANGTTRTFEYFWGADKSGSEQGAGGVGGLLAMSVDGMFYIPCYDHNGNIVLYVSEIGSIAAQYTYDPYGNIIDSSGSLANVFSFGFSTKYHDREVSLISYQKRFYRPDHGRWLNRDPIEEEGGENLYAFCGNNVVSKYDKDGCAYFAYRPLTPLRWIGIIGNEIDEYNNTVIAHENLFFEDGKSPSNLGYFKDGLHPDNDNHGYKSAHLTGFDDCIMRKAVAKVRPMPYSLLGGRDRFKYNCQDWAEEVRIMYYAIRDGRTYYPKSTKFIGGKN